MLPRLTPYCQGDRLVARQNNRKFRQGDDVRDGIGGGTEVHVSTLADM